MFVFCVMTTSSELENPQSESFTEHEQTSADGYSTTSYLKTNKAVCVHLATQL